MSLIASLRSRITQDGPISVADYMSECLLHPEYGYYTTRNPLGATGDFTTAPEISQMFGELLGLCLVQCWLDQDEPSPFILAELGPGRGTLMADMLRATKAVPGFHEAMQLRLIEASPVLRNSQGERLLDYQPEWLDSVEDLPQAPLFLVANEFFDALPIRQFLRQGALWQERRIGITADGGPENGLTFGLSTPTAQPALDHRLKDTENGDLVEICPAAAVLTEALAQRIADHGGAALILDYGDWRSQGDTLQALSGHQATDPLKDPGNADLTAHVDFETLATSAAASGCAHTRITPQGVFLERLGITDRARALAQNKTDKEVDALITAHRRLTHPEEMGTLFKVIGLYPKGAPLPAGLGK